MAVMKAPQVDYRMLNALRMFLRIDYGLAVQYVLQEHKSDPENLMAKLMKLADLLLENDTPLSVSASLMESGAAEVALLPMSDGRFQIYWEILNRRIQYQDLRAIGKATLCTEEEFAKILTLQSQLKAAWSGARSLDTDEVQDSNQYRELLN